MKADNRSRIIEAATEMMAEHPPEMGMLILRLFCRKAIPESIGSESKEAIKQILLQIVEHERQHHIHRPKNTDAWPSAQDVVLNSIIKGDSNDQ